MHSSEFDLTSETCDPEPRVEDPSLNTTYPSISDLVSLIEALQRYPLGGVLLLLLVLAIVLGIWAFRAPRISSKRGRETLHVQYGRLRSHRTETYGG